MTTTPGGLPQELLNKRDVRLGMLDVRVAAEDTAYNAATWKLPVGIIDPDSFRTSAPKEMFDLKTGFPSTTKVQAITGMELSIAFNLHEANARAIELCAGSGDTEYTYTGTPAATYAKASPAPTENGFDLNSATGYAVGQHIEVTMDDGSKEYTYIDTISSATITVQPPLSAAVTGGAGNVVKGVLLSKNAIGSSEIPRKALKVSFTDNYGNGMILHVPGFTPVGNFAPQWSNGKRNMIVPVELKAYGKSATWQGTTQNVLGYIYRTFPGSA